MAATSEQQSIKDRMVLQALKFVFQPKNAKNIEQSAKGGDPAQAVAASTAMLVKQVMTAAGNKGVNIDKRFVLPVGKEVIANVIDMLVAFKVVPEKLKKQTLAASFMEFADIVGAGRPPKPTGMLQGA